MKSTVLASLALLAASLVEGAAVCDAPTASLSITANEIQTVSAGTSATVDALGTAVVLECGQASVTSRGVVTLSGGTATLKGDTNFYTSATAYITGSGRLVDGNMGTFTAAPSATVTIFNGNQVRGVAGDGASIVFEGGGSQNFVTGGVITVSALNAGMNARATGSGARLYASNTAGGGGGNVVAAGAGVTAIALGVDVGAGAANGGVAYMSGQGGFCSMGVSGTCTVAGTTQWLYCFATGSADVLGGSSNSANFGRGCSGTVSGTSNRVTVSSLASATILAGATATVPAGGAVYVGSDVSNVIVSSAGTATLAAGATVTAAPAAVLFAASPQVTYESVADDSNGNVIYAARSAGTHFRRAALPLQTGRCSRRQAFCPDLMGQFRCVDIESDIFNCGGCSLSDNVQQAGVDCTNFLNDDVKCVSGQCVA